MQNMLLSMLNIQDGCQNSATWSEERPLVPHLTWFLFFSLLDFATISRLMGVKWHQLSDKEKAYYQNMQRKQTVKHKNIPSLSAKKLSSRRGSGHSGKHNWQVEQKPGGRGREWATLGVHPLSWLLSNNRLEKVPFVSVPHTSSNRLLLSNQDKGCTPSVAHHSLTLPLGPALLNLWIVWRRWGYCGEGVVKTDERSNKPSITVQYHPQDQHYLTKFITWKILNLKTPPRWGCVLGSKRKGWGKGVCRRQKEEAR